MTDIVLVHGMSHGGWCWDRMVPLLAGHRVVTPTLGAGDLSTHIGVVTEAVDGLSNLVLVGHSYGGMVISGVASAAPYRIARMVYLDAFVPTDGQCFYDLNSPGFRDRLEALAVDGAIPPLPPAVFGITEPADIAWVEERLTSHPIASLREPVRVSAEARALPSTYVHCERGTFHETAVRCGAMGWPVIDLDAGHDAMITAPAELAAILRQLAERSG